LPCGLRPAACRLPHRRIRNQEAQPVHQIQSAPALKRKSGSVDDFTVFRNIAGQHAQVGSHGIEQR
jgi:hypothetical protein